MAKQAVDKDGNSKLTNREASAEGLVFKPEYDEPDQEVPQDEQPDEIKVEEDELQRDTEGKATEGAPSANLEAGKE